MGYTSRGLAYLSTEDYGRTIEDYTTAIDLNPDDASAYCVRGMVWLHLEKWKEGKFRHDNS